jgi:hypothetical protein
LNDELLTLAGGQSTKNLELVCTLFVSPKSCKADTMLNGSQKIMSEISQSASEEKLRI